MSWNRFGKLSPLLHNSDDSCEKPKGSPGELKEGGGEGKAKSIGIRRIRRPTWNLLQFRFTYSWREGLELARLFVDGGFGNYFLILKNSCFWFFVCFFEESWIKWSLSGTECVLQTLKSGLECELHSFTKKFGL